MDHHWHEVREEFSSYEDFIPWFSTSRWLTDTSYARQFVESIQRLGMEDPLFGWIRSEKIEINGTNYRETISYGGHNSRIRAVLDEFLRHFIYKYSDIDIYAPESLTHLAENIRTKLNANFTGSEYIPTDEAKRMHPGVRHEDVTNLSFDDASFDFYITSEVLEHVPDVHAKLREARRILRPGGKMIGTFPFYYGGKNSIVKAVMRDGEILHLQEPEYHGNPTDPEKGSLVFTIPGWEILDWARGAGFSRTYFVARSSRRFGIRAAELGAVMIFVAEA